MLTSLALIFLVGLMMAAICQRLKLPRIIGMLVTGMVLGPYVLNAFAPSILEISGDLRQMALIIILIKAGLSLDVADLKRVGRPALLLACLPAAFEIAAFYLFAPRLMGITQLEAAIMGAVLGAVSPAVVVPRMVDLMERHYGTDRRIPQMILAGASLDDVFVIVLFSAFLGMEQGGSVSAMALVQIPTAIVLGVLLGATVGWALARLFERAFTGGNLVRNSVKVMVVLGVSFLLTAAETYLKGTMPISGLLAVMSMACMLQKKSAARVVKRLAQKFGKLWIAAEVVLFVLVGAAVDIRYTLQAGMPAVGMIFLALAFRCAGVAVSLIRTPLCGKEKLFCMLAYLPKATVQAAIGAVPLSLGLACGPIVLSVAVLSIVITAPLGAMAMDMSYQTLLKRGQTDAHAAADTAA